MRVRAVVLAAAAAVVVLAPPTARAADLVVWWEEGYNAAEDAAIRETAAAFEQKTGKQVVLSLHAQSELPGELHIALQAGRPPDLAFATFLNQYAPGLASEGRLVDLTATVASLSVMFDADAVERWTTPGPQASSRLLYGLPIGRVGNYLHVWKSLLERAGYTPADIPKAWGPFWAFWCDTVQPAVRKALGRDDVWGVGLPMSAAAPNDSRFVLMEFVHALGADYVTPEGRLVIDDPRIRAGLVAALEGYTAA